MVDSQDTQLLKIQVAWILGRHTPPWPMAVQKSLIKWLSWKEPHRIGIQNTRNWLNIKAPRKEKGKEKNVNLSKWNNYILVCTSNGVSANALYTTHSLLHIAAWWGLVAMSFPPVSWIKEVKIKLDLTLCFATYFLTVLIEHSSLYITLGNPCTKAGCSEIKKY